jgi:hypothetical protein
MNKIFLIVLATIALQANADPVWIEQNKLVGDIGGWRTYAKEKVAPGSPALSANFSLSQAIERAWRNQLDWTNYLPGSESISNYSILSPAQRSALQQRYAIAYETTKAYYELVLLKEKLAYMENVLDAVATASELTNRMFKVGNTNQLNQLKQQNELYKKQLEMNALQTKYSEGRERFLQRMNFGASEIQFEVEARLPNPPNNSKQLTDKERKAIDLGTINNPASVQVRSNARIAHQAYLNLHQAALKYKNEILPNQMKISEEKLLRYNAMLTDVFHLLEDAEDQSKVVMRYIDANAALLIQSARLEKALIDAQMDFSNINAR